MTEALSALVSFSEEETRAAAAREAREEERERRQEIREEAQEARECLMVRLTVGGVFVGVASVVVAVIFH